MTIDQLVQSLLLTYGRKNTFRFAGESYCLELHCRFTGIQEAIRKGKHENVPRLLADLCAWGLSFVGQLQIDFNQLMAGKFPGCCVYCRRKPCNCHLYPEKPPIQPLLAFNATGFTLNHWQELLDEIYPNDRRDIAMIMSKISEELGEATSACRRRELDVFQGELADFFSWIFAMANKLGINLEETVIVPYGQQCPKCKCQPCECSDHEIATNYRP